MLIFILSAIFNFFYLFEPIINCDDKETILNIGGKNIYYINSDSIIVFKSGLMVDADGCPTAYHPEKGKGLDYLRNAGKEGNWWALVTDTREKDGNPVVQGNGDPAPGYYISTTSLQDKSKKYKDPSRYVNSCEVPYISLPAQFLKKVKLGDIGLVYNSENNKSSFVIFADVGPAGKVGEGSIKLAENLELNSNPKNGGTEKNVIYFILFPRSGNKTPITNLEIDARGKKFFGSKSVDEIVKCINQ